MECVVFESVIHKCGQFFRECVACPHELHAGYTAGAFVIINGGSIGSAGVNCKFAFGVAFCDVSKMEFP